MRIYFTETEPSEQEFFRRELEEHDLSFVASLAEVGEDAEILSPFIYSRVSAEFLETHPRLRLVASRSSGHDHINLLACRERGVSVSIVPSYGDNTVAEHTFALLLAVSRRLRLSMNTHEGNHFTYETLRGFDLKGRTLGVIGSGRIGLHVIRIARAFGMRVLAYDLNPNRFMSEILGFEYHPLDALLENADILTLHIPLMAGTYHLLNRETLARCRRGVIVINTARGALIDTEALIEALETGQVGGAGLDVLEEEQVLHKESLHIISEQIVRRLQSGVAPEELRASDPERVGELQRLMRNAKLIARPDVVFTPHTAFNSLEAVARINRTTLGNIRAFLEGHPTHPAPGLQDS